MRKNRDDGFGLTEVMISMLLLVILFLAMISLLITALQVVGENSTRASAGQLATQRMEDVRREAAIGSGCANIATVAEASFDTEDGRGIPLNVVASVADCDAVPTLARVTVTVTTTAPGLSNPVSVVTSDIFVKGTT